MGDVEKVEDAALGEGTAERALEEPGESGLTLQQFAARVAVKREQAAQDAGWVTPPGLADDVEPVDEETQRQIEEARTPLEEDVLEPDENGEQTPPEEAEQPEEQPDEEEGEPEDEVEEFYVARYRTKEAAEAALAEKDRVIDQALRENAEFRARLEEREAEQEQQPREIDVPAWNAWAQEAVENGAGVRGAMAALEQGGEQAFDLYVSHWVASEDPNERAQAVAFNNEVVRQQAQIRAIAAVSPLVEQRRADEGANEAEVARDQIAAQYPDFEEYAAEIDRLVNEAVVPLETQEWLAEMAREGGLKGKVRAWDYLYKTAKAARAPSRQRAAEAERKQRRASADAAKVSASVSSAEGTPARTPLTEAERFALERKNELREKTGLPLLTE